MSNGKHTLPGRDSRAPSSAEPSEDPTLGQPSAASETDAARCVQSEAADACRQDRPRARPTSALVVRNRTGARGAGVTILGVKR